MTIISGNQNTTVEVTRRSFSVQVTLDVYKIKWLANQNSAIVAPSLSPPGQLSVNGSKKHRRPLRHLPALQVLRLRTSVSAHARNLCACVLFPRMRRSPLTNCHVRSRKSSNPWLFLSKKNKFSKARRIKVHNYWLDQYTELHNKDTSQESQIVENALRLNFGDVSLFQVKRDFIKFIDIHSCDC